MTAPACGQLTSLSCDSEGEITGDIPCGKPAVAPYGSDRICLDCARALRDEGGILSDSEIEELEALELADVMDAAQATPIADLPSSDPPPAEAP